MGEFHWVEIGNYKVVEIVVVDGVAAVDRKTVEIAAVNFDCAERVAFDETVVVVVVLWIVVVAEVDGKVVAVAVVVAVQNYCPMILHYF